MSGVTGVKKDGLWTVSVPGPCGAYFIGHGDTFETAFLNAMVGLS